AFFAKSVEMSEGTLKVELHDVLANDDHGVGLIRFTATRGGKSLADNAVQVFHVRGGKATEVWSHAGDAAAVDQFWS
ncbi:MAG: nuclear transport factor 2 family protein, partial [Acidimicrobiia bacterium]